MFCGTGSGKVNGAGGQGVARKTLGLLHTRSRIYSYGEPTKHSGFTQHRPASDGSLCMRLSIQPLSVNEMFLSIAKVRTGEQSNG